MLESLLRDNMDEIVGQVASATEAGTTESTNFVTTVMGILQEEAAAGRLDLGALLKGDFGSLKNALSFEKLGGLLGGSAEAGEKGVEAMMIPVSDSLQNLGSQMGGVDGLLQQILGVAGGGEAGGGGILGIVGGLLGGGADDAADKGKGDERG